MLNVNTKTLGTIAVLSLQGEIVNGQTELLRNAMHSLSGVSAVKLDLARVTTVDAGGLGVMLALREQAESRGIPFELMNVNQRVFMVLRLTRLDTVFRITNGVEYFRTMSRSRTASVSQLRSCA